jgi:hypothetical protein
MYSNTALLIDTRTPNATINLNKYQIDPNRLTHQFCSRFIAFKLLGEQFSQAVLDIISESVVKPDFVTLDGTVPGPRIHRFEQGGHAAHCGCEIAALLVEVKQHGHYWRFKLA